MTEPRWLEIALHEIGAREVAGSKANPRIIDYFKECTWKATSDEIPWCSAYACWCMEQASVPSPKSARARDWLNWGVAIYTPLVGCIVVLQRTTDITKGHVGFFIHETDTHVGILGGNQNNEVNITEYLKTDIISFRMPENKYYDVLEITDAKDDTGYS